MKVFLRKDVEKIGMAGEVVKVEDGFARNFLIPRKIAVEVKKDNAAFYASRVKVVEGRKEVIASKTSMLAEKISGLKVTIKRKMHDNGKLYGSISQNEIADELGKKGIAVSKGQIVINKSIKTKGEHAVVVKLTSRLQPKVRVSVISE